MKLGEDGPNMTILAGMTDKEPTARDSLVAAP